MSATTYYDGNYDKPVPVGASVPWRDQTTQSILYTQRYHQKAAKFVPATWSLKGRSNSLLVEESLPSDSGIAGIIEFERIYAHVPASRFEWEDFVHNLQGILDGDIVELPIYTNSKIVFDYFHTFNPDTIRMYEAFHAVKTGGVIYLLGQVPGNSTWIVAENSVLRRWRGNIWERATRYVRSQELNIHS